MSKDETIINSAKTKVEHDMTVERDSRGRPKSVAYTAVTDKPSLRNVTVDGKVKRDIFLTESQLKVLNYKVGEDAFVQQEVTHLYDGEGYKAGDISTAERLTACIDAQVKTVGAKGSRYLTIDFDKPITRNDKNTIDPAKRYEANRNVTNAMKSAMKEHKELINGKTSSVEKPVVEVKASEAKTSPEVQAQIAKAEASVNEKSVADLAKDASAEYER